ncbi:phage shock protein operon transcriptional activator [Permianibacter sp. IMCC34836]|uniref:phage shock protein operon transcriptional activator n=1 Tax=Permianibacter fluminis TaxID=2738515 RepID=UPI001555687C|nr:phage shock protein operon transcriptional activator [Permianibacter fluminis]NQD38725.1 phage shock protein operon transcriptional activator [Permianibacter fluminis]
MAERAQAHNLIGESAVFLEMLEHISLVAPLAKPVLVIGERGTGKELVAARLHYLSRRWDQPFLKLNCAAINENLLETELFGHEAGSFTGAAKRHLGRFELADGGSFFLDELANTSARVQEKLLRVIEYGEFERVGGNQSIKANVRLIAATNEDLPALAQQGRFRYDLLDRLAFDVITLPPLRVRPDDILKLAQHFAVAMTKELGRDYFAGFSKAAEQQLLDYSWPGNVRELKNVVERNVYRCAPDRMVSKMDFDPFTSPWRPRLTPPAAMTTGNSPAPSTSDGTALPLDFKQVTEQHEIGLIKRALQQGQFNQKKAAELLGLTYHQLRGYLKKYQLLKDEG